MRRQVVRAGRIGSSFAVSGLVIAAIVAANVLAARTTVTADLTEGRRLTLSPETRAVLDQVDDRLSIEIFVQPDSATGRDAAALGSRYEDANGHIDLEVVDPDAEPGRAERLGVTRFGTAVLRYGDRRIDITTTSEIELTSAILRLVRGRVPVVCFVTGHGEADIGDEGPQGLSSFAELADRNGFATEARNVGVEGLDGCEIVVIAGARVPFATKEVDALRDHLGADGKMMVLADALSEADINPIVDEWGIRFLGGVVLDRASNFGNDVSTAVLTDFPSANQVVEDVPSVLAPAAAGLLVEDPDPRPGLHVSVLARTSDDSILAADPEDPARGGVAGPIVVAAAADDSRVEGETPRIRRTRLLVIGNVAFAHNASLPALGNAKLLANALSWLAQDDLLLTLATKSPGFEPLVVTPARRRTAVAIAAIGMPVVVLVAGLSAVVLRRRR